MEVAQTYVAEGLAGRERVAYVGEGGPDELRHDLDGVPALNEELDRGQLQLVPMNTLAGSEASVDPAVELPQLAAMTEDALVAGYRALGCSLTGPAGCGTRRSVRSRCVTSI